MVLVFSDWLYPLVLFSFIALLAFSAQIELKVKPLAFFFAIVSMLACSLLTWSPPLSKATGCFLFATLVLIQDPKSTVATILRATEVALLTLSLFAIVALIIWMLGFRQPVGSFILNGRELFLFPYGISPDIFNYPRSGLLYDEPGALATVASSLVIINVWCRLAFGHARHTVLSKVAMLSLTMLTGSPIAAGVFCVLIFQDLASYSFTRAAGIVLMALSFIALTISFFPDITWYLNYRFQRILSGEDGRLAVLDVFPELLSNPALVESLPDHQAHNLIVIMVKHFGPLGIAFGLTLFLGLLVATFMSGRFIRLLPWAMIALILFYVRPYFFNAGYLIIYSLLFSCLITALPRSTGDRRHRDSVAIGI